MGRQLTKLALFVYKLVLFPHGLSYVTGLEVTSFFSDLSEGVEIMEGIRVVRVETAKERVSQVHTNQGPVNCEYFINCAGMVSLSQL